MKTRHPLKRQDQRQRLERRRLEAGRLLLKGVPQAEVARRAGVSRPTVFEWKERMKQGGLKALRNGTRGRRPRLDEAMRKELVKALREGAGAHGYADELWTLPRIAKLIEKRFEYVYSISQVSRLLETMRGNSRRSEKGASQRHEKPLRQWKGKRWPTVKTRLKCGALPPP